MQRVFNLQTKGVGGWFNLWKHWIWVPKITAYSLLTFFSYCFAVVVFLVCLFACFFILLICKITTFLISRCSCISKTYKYYSRPGWSFWRMPLRGGGVFSWLPGLWFATWLGNKPSWAHFQGFYLDFWSVFFFPSKALE